MIKSAFIGLSLASFLTAGVAIAEDKMKVEPGKGPTEAVTNAVPAMKPAASADTGKATASETPVACSQADLTAMITKAGALTDADKKKMTMGHLESAKKSMDLKDMDGCAMHMKEASATLGTVTK